MTETTAQQIHEHLEKLIEHANEALYLANNSDDPELKVLTQEALGIAIAEIDLQVCSYIYRRFPHLKPSYL
jgi:MarR-like DNA-binding transcriptional regulator SgrR of sgrS sRNA